MIAPQVPFIYPTSLQSLFNEKKGDNMFKEYFNKHKDTIITISVVILIDHFLFKGQLMEKIKETLEGLLNNCRVQNEK